MSKISSGLVLFSLLMALSIGAALSEEVVNVTLNASDNASVNMTNITNMTNMTNMTNNMTNMTNGTIVIIEPETVTVTESVKE